MTPPTIGLHAGLLPLGAGFPALAPRLRRREDRHGPDGGPPPLLRGDRLGVPGAVQVPVRLPLPVRPRPRRLRLPDGPRPVRLPRNLRREPMRRAGARPADLGPRHQVPLRAAPVRRGRRGGGARCRRFSGACRGRCGGGAFSDLRCVCGNPSSDIPPSPSPGLDAGAESEGDVPSPLDFAAFFSDIANYDYAPLGHQAHTLFDALAKVRRVIGCL
jgi:hypothetical protein